MMKFSNTLTLVILLIVSACTSEHLTYATDKQQDLFATPSLAVNALVSASRSGDTSALRAILGPQSSGIISSGDPVADAAGRQRFLSAYDARHRLEHPRPDTYILLVGSEQWPLPIPLVRDGHSWRFDTQAGKEEILNRRIGRNELSVMRLCHAYVQAQKEYAREHHGSAGGIYARRFVSTPGTHDGLYWPVPNGEPQSPFGPLMARAWAEGYDETQYDKMIPYHGYYYHILTRQGPHAKGGAKTYIARGRMRGGFALVAFPARYGDSGIMTFIVGKDGVIYQKNLGPGTRDIAARMTRFDPDPSWQKAQ